MIAGSNLTSSLLEDHDSTQVRNFSELTLWYIYFALLLSFSLLYPALNWPDEAYKISRLYDPGNLYLRLIDFLQGGTCSVSFYEDPRAYFGSNKLAFQIISGELCYYHLKIINSIIIMVISSLVFLFFDKKRRLVFLMSSLWPSSLFYLSSINNQVTYHIAAIFIGTYIAFGGKRLFALLAAIVLLPLDSSFIAVIVFLSVSFFIRINRQLVIVGAVIFLSLFQFFQPVLEFLFSTLFGEGALELSQIAESNEIYRDSIFLTLALFLTSFVYLGGTAAVFGIGLDYAIFALYGIRRTLRVANKKEFFDEVVSLLITMLIIIQIVPTISSFRYYVFIFPIAIGYLMPQNHRNYYVIYCIVMSVIYIAMANTVHLI